MSGRPMRRDDTVLVRTPAHITSDACMLFAALTTATLTTSPLAAMALFDALQMGSVDCATDGRASSDAATSSTTRRTLRHDGEPLMAKDAMRCAVLCSAALRCAGRAREGGWAWVFVCGDGRPSDADAASVVPVLVVCGDAPSGGWLAGRSVVFGRACAARCEIGRRAKVDGCSARAAAAQGEADEGEGDEKGER